MSLYDQYEAGRRSGAEPSAGYMQGQIAQSMQRHGHGHLLQERQQRWANAGPTVTYYSAGGSQGHAEEYEIHMTAPHDSQEGTSRSPVRRQYQRRRRRTNTSLDRIEDS